ncbi:hypothetical protein LCGC14_2997860, partial [marine sediment metagenome]
KILSDTDIGMCYKDLPFEKQKEDEFDEMMQRFVRTFGESEVQEDGSFCFYSWRGFAEKDRNAVMTPKT